MIRFLYWMFLFPLAVGTAFGANWYVDGKATGVNNGTNWANAWANPANIVWASVNPGDTIFVSGGTTSLIYTNDLVFGKDGTPSNYITVRIGQNPGHNGVAIFDGCRITMGSYPQWVAIDGGRSASFVAPTNHQQVITGSTAITNNIGFWIRNVTGTNDSDSSPCVWYFRGASNLRFSYIEVSGLTNTTPNEFDGAVSYANEDSGVDMTNIVFEYLYCHNNECRVFDWLGQSARNFDEVTFRYGNLYLNAEDHFQVGGGWTIRDSVIGPCNGDSFHTDFFQLTGSFWKIYNNDIRESQNSIMRLQTMPNTVTHDMWFFNNLVTEKLGRAPKGGTGVEPFCMVNFDPQHYGDMTTYSNIIFANNLFYNSVSNAWDPITLAPDPSGMYPNPFMTWAKGSETNAFVRHCLFVNNLVVDKENGLNFPTLTNGWYSYTIGNNTDYTTNGSLGYLPVGYNTFTTNDFIVDYNVIAATNTALNTPMNVNYLDVTNGVSYTGVGTFGTPGWPTQYKFSNTTNYPAFVDKANDNFELQPSDTAALNTGMNLSSYFNFDSLNRPRNVGGAWDRGPLEYQGSGPTSGSTNGLLVWLTFNDDFSTNNGKLVDSSGNGNNAYRFGRIGSVYPTNFPIQIASTNTPGRTNLSSPDYCGRFNWWTNNAGGDYAGITNVASLTNMATASIMCWARYYPPNTGPGYPPNLDWTSDANSELLSAGASTGVTGTWGLGRYNGQGSHNNNTRFFVETNASAADDASILEFPEDGTQDDTTNWTHYAVTWTNGVMIGYMNGAAFQTNDVSAITTHLQIGANNNNPTPWIGIGVNTHGGTPWLGDDEYPNNGWMNGVIDDVRIYNRALTAAEVQAVYSSGGDTVLAAKPSPPTGLMIIARIGSQHVLSSH